jgi:hypothetical protein
MAASLFKWLIILSHPLYITVTEINHNGKDKTLEISCKMFTNDFESVLEKTSHSKIDLSDGKSKTANDKLIADYVEKHLQLKVDGRLVSMHFIGSEKEEDGTWSYFQVDNIPSVKKLDINNNLLYDGFSQEINIMHVKAAGVEKSTRLDYPAATASFEF